MKQNYDLKIESPAFKDGEYLDRKYTGFGQDISPPFHILNPDGRAVTIAIIMDDLDIPFIRAYNHWLIWNIPVSSEIPEGIPHGEEVPSLGNAVQGIGYGKNRYRGPKQPAFIRNMHRYVFQFYVLDCILQIEGRSRKADLVVAMEGHILQTGSITGKYKR